MTTVKSPSTVDGCRNVPVASSGNALAKQKSMTRRIFFQGSLGMAGIFPLCCISPEIPRECMQMDGEKVILDLSSIGELKKVGSAAVIFDDRRKLNMIVIHVTRKHFAALDRTCTHGGAMCSYNHNRHTLQCTSLGHAEYSLDGTLLHERTHGNLQSYRVKLNGKRLEIFLGAKG